MTFPRNKKIIFALALLASVQVANAQQLKDADPKMFTELIKNLSNYEHSVNYYGPLSVSEISAIVDKTHKTVNKLQAVPKNNRYVRQEAVKNEVWIAPFDAKNIYMRTYHNENRDWNINEAAVMAVFNEYFGGGMNGIVFQEMREARGLAYNASAMYSRPGRDCLQHRQRGPHKAACKFTNHQE